MDTTRDFGQHALEKAARLNVWRMIEQFERAGYSARQTAYYMAELAASAFDVSAAALSEATEPAPVP